MTDTVEHPCLSHSSPVSYLVSARTANALGNQCIIMCRLVASLIKYCILFTRAGSSKEYFSDVYRSMKVMAHEQTYHDILPRPLCVACKFIRSYFDNYQKKHSVFFIFRTNSMLVKMNHVLSLNCVTSTLAQSEAF